MTDYEYYKGQIDRLGNKLDYTPTMKLHSEHGESKYLNVNKDSLKALIDYALENNLLDNVQELL